MEEILKVENLSKSYGKKLILDKLNFTVNQGDIIGLVGINGCGKTTLFKCICNLLNYQGEITINKVKNNKPEQNFKDLLMIFDNETSFPSLTVFECLYSLSKFYGKFEKDEINKIIDKVGLVGKQKVKLKTLSFGQKQRVNLAKVFIVKPKIVLMDEPFNGVDVNGVDFIIDFVRNFNKVYNMTFVVSSHQVTELESFTNRILALDNNHIISDTYVNDIKTSLVSVKLVNENDIEKIKANYKIEKISNGYVYIECEKDSEDQIANWLIENSIAFTYFSSDNAIRQQIMK